MSETSTLQIRLNTKLKKEAKEIAISMGMDLTTIVRLCLQQMVNQRKLPFTPEAPDPFYSKENIDELKKSIKQAQMGKLINMSIEELEAMEK